MPGNAGGGGSSPDNVGTGRYCQTVRVRLARPKGVTRVNQCLKLRKSSTGSNLVDEGRDAVHDHFGGRLRSRLDISVGRPR